MEIQSFPLYMVYPDGTVFTRIRRKFLKQNVNQGGYHRVCLSRDGKQKMFCVHRLVGEAFIPNPDNKPELDHINQDKSDNRIENLRWVTSSENNQNKGIMITNTSGHKNICYHKHSDRWQFRKEINNVKYQKYFRTKIEAIVYKFCFILTHKQLQERHH
tara:strand:- start:77 stop:553 length:477 start_codon:yes stop_codon:yes gene_type:complete